MGADDYVRGFEDGVKAAREVARLGLDDDTPIHPQIDPEPMWRPMSELEDDHPRAVWIMHESGRESKDTLTRRASDHSLPPEWGSRIGWKEARP